MRATPARCVHVMLGLVGSLIAFEIRGADEKVNTTVYSWVSDEYHREQLADGAIRPEFYAISNGGRIPGTTTDSTVDKVTYPEIAGIAMRLLATQGYHYGMTARQATLLIVLQWGETVPYNRTNYEAAIEYLSAALQDGDIDAALMRIRAENAVRAYNNRANAWILGYADEIEKADNPLKYAGFGDRYYDLVGEIEESRYYIVISAYDFHEALKGHRPKLLWVTRVSIETRQNAFDTRMASMLNNAAKYFGRDCGLIRGEELKPQVAVGELKVLDMAENAKVSEPPPTPKPAAAKPEKK